MLTYEGENVPIFVLSTHVDAIYSCSASSYSHEKNVFHLLFYYSIYFFICVDAIDGYSAIVLLHMKITRNSSILLM